MQSHSVFHSFLRTAVAAATIASLGAPAAFAAQKNQSVSVSARSRTNVFSVQNSFAGNFSGISQDSNGTSNQSARARNRANSEVNSDINASSGNVIVIVQD